MPTHFDSLILFQEIHSTETLPHVHKSICRSILITTVFILEKNESQRT